MSVSWREVVGLLIGLAVCCGLVYYAVTQAPRYAETAQEQGAKDSRWGATEPQGGSTVSEGETKTVTVRITGATGESFGANIGNLTFNQTVEGTVPAGYEIKVRTSSEFGDYVAATVWKTSGNSKELKVQLLDGGRVVKESSTTEDYGVTGVRWTPNEQPPPETTTTPKAKAEGPAGSKAKAEGGPRP